MGSAHQTELSGWAYRRCRDGPEHRCHAQSSHAKVLKKSNRCAVPVATGEPGRAPSLVDLRLAHARTRHQGPREVMYTRAGLRARARPLWFSDAAGTDLSIDVVPVLNHEAVAGALPRVRDILSVEAPVRQFIIQK